MVETETECSQQGLSKAGSLLLFCFLFSFLFSTPAAANTTIFQNAGTTCTTINVCSQLSYFGVLTGVSDTLTFNGKGTIGNLDGVGVQTGSTMKVVGTGTSANTFGNIIDFADPVHAVTGACAAVGGTPNPNLCGNGTINGATTTASGLPHQANSLVTLAGTQLTNIESYLASPTYSGTAGSFSGSITNVEAAGVYDSTHKLSVYTASNFSQGGAAITIGCTGTNCANDLVIIQLSGTTAAFNANINLTGGLQSDQVIFYFASAGMAVTVNPTSAAATLNADFFAQANQLVTLGGTGGSSKSVDFEGRIYGSSILFNNKGVSVQDIGEIPEPGTWAMMAGGLGLAIWLRRKRVGRKDA